MERLTSIESIEIIGSIGLMTNGLIPESKF